MTDVFDDMDRIALDRIGDPVVYRPGGGAALSPAIKGWVNHGDDVQQFQVSAGVVADASVQIRVIDVAEPSKADTIELPELGLTFQVKDWTRDVSGRYWNLRLKKYNPPAVAP